MKNILRWALGSLLVLAGSAAAIVLSFVVFAMIVRPTGPVLTLDEPAGLAGDRQGPNEGLLISNYAGPVVTIDIFEVAPERREQALRDASRLLIASAANAQFSGGALLEGLPADVQPLRELGFVPSRAWVAIYARWKSSKDSGHGATAEGRGVLAAMTDYAPWAAQMLADPQISLYKPTLIDATGELCAHKLCPDGEGVGPLLDAANSRATFINIFETTPDRQERLLKTTYAIMPTARGHEGYLRTALHRSLDGTRVANVGQYETYRQIGAMYYHLETLGAFGQVFVKDVTTPLARLGPLIIGDYPRLRTYRVVDVVEGEAFAPFQGVKANEES